MVTRYDVIKWGGQANFWWKYMFFQLLSTIKVNLVAKILQSVSLCVIFHVKHKKLPFLAVLTWHFQFLVKSKMAAKMTTIAGDAGLNCSTTHKIYLILLRRSKAFHQRQNRFKILQHIKNSGEGLHPSTPPVPRWGYEFACSSEG